MLGTFLVLPLLLGFRSSWVRSSGVLLYIEFLNSSYNVLEEKDGKQRQIFVCYSTRLHQAIDRYQEIVCRGKQEREREAERDTMGGEDG